MFIKKFTPKIKANKARSYTLSAAALVLGLILFAAPEFYPQTTPQNKQSDYSVDQNLRGSSRINPSTLAMELNISLMNYPGRAGNSMPFGFSYSSKVWRMDDLFTYSYQLPYSCTRQNVTQLFPKYGERSIGGWTSTISPPIIEQRVDLYDALGRPIGNEFDEVFLPLMLSSLTQGYTELTENAVARPDLPCGNYCAAYNRWAMCIRYDYNGWCNTECLPGDACESNPGNGGGGCGGNGPNYEPTLSFYVKRLNVRTPDGATHEFRKSDGRYGYCYATGNPNNGPGCNTNLADNTGSFLSVDGSGMRLERDSSGSTLFMPNGSKYKFPAENQHVGDNGRMFFATEYQDVNGNVTTFTENVVGGQIFPAEEDTMGRLISDPLPMNIGAVVEMGEKSQSVSLPGFNGGTQEFELIWKKLKHPDCADSTDPRCNDGEGALDDQSQKLYYDTDLMCFGGSETAITGTNEFLFPVDGWGLRSCATFSFEENPNGMPIPTPHRFNPAVLAGIQLPNGKGYTFKYNQYGEISKIIYPSGSFETFTYGRVTPLSKFVDGAYNQTNRGVTEHKIYSAGSTTPEQTWHYEADPNPTGDRYKITTYGSKADNASQLVKRSERYLIKGIMHGERFGFDSPLAGMPAEECVFDDNGALRARTLTEYTVTGPVPTGDQNNPARAEAQRDGRVSKSISVAIEGNDALATMSENVYQDPITDGGIPTNPSYFAKLNVKEKRSYHYKSIPLSTAQNGSLETIAAYFNGAPLASVSQTDYSYDQAYFERGIIGLPTETRVLNSANLSEVIAKSQMVYDQTPAPNSQSTYPMINAGASPTWQDPGSDLRGNPTTSRTWKKETNTWLETHAQLDNFGNLRKVWDASGDSSKCVETVYEHDPGNGKPYHFAYPTKVITPAPDPNGTQGTDQTSSLETTYDPTTGLVLTVKDDFGQITRTEYNDPLLRPTRVFGENFTAPIAETIYDDDIRTIKVRKQLDEINWDEATTYMDSLGRAVKTVAKDSEGEVMVETHYDLLGRVDRITNPYRAGETVYWNKTRYDELGRAVEGYAPASLGDLADAQSLGITSFSISTVANYTGTVVTTTDASGRKGRSITNALGQLLRVEEPTAVGGPNDLGDVGSPSQPTYYKYDAYGNMVQVTQGVQNRYFKYNSLGRLVRVNQPEQEYHQGLDLPDAYNTSGHWTAAFDYDDLGNLVTTIDAKGVTTVNSYDRAGRVTTRAYYGEPDPGPKTPAVYFFYDGKGLGGEQTPNYAKGKLTKVSSSVSETRYKLFDNFSRLKEMEQRTPATDTETVAQATPRISKYTYNFSGALVEEEYPSGRVVKNSLGTDGGLTTVSSRVFNGDYRTYASGFSYTASGAINKIMLGNGRWETAQFNARQQLTQLGLGTSVANTSLWKVDYEYGELRTDGNIDSTKNTGNIGRQTLTIPGTSFTQSYKYDPLYRLTEAKEVTGTSSSANWTQAFGYDVYGNRTSFSQTVGGIQTNGTPLVDPNTNRFTSSNFTYDKNGNITQDTDPVTNQARQTTFNGDNKQVEVRDANGNSIGKYYYDGEGKRVKKVTATETTIFVYSGGKLVAEYSTQISQNPTISYTTTDHLGSPRVITDKLGNVRSRRDFMPFGEDIFAGVGGRTGDTGQRYSSSADDIRQKFTGYQKDSETNLDFAEARMYENRYGRFTVVDPLLASGKSANPQTFNRYIYVGNRPTNLTDKYGLEWYRNGNRFEWSYDNKTLVNGDTIDDNWKLVTDHVYYNDEVGWTVLDPFARDWTDHFESREEAVDFLNPPQDISLADGVDEMMLVYDAATIVGGVVRHAGKAVLREGGELLAERFIKKTAVEVLRESAEKELVAAGKKVTTLAINKVVGRLAENLVEKHLVQEGYEILGRQVTAKLTNGQIRYIDRLVKSPTGDIMAIEVKSGGAIYREAQMAKDMLIEKVGATLGNRAPDNLIGTFVKLKTIVRRVE